MQLLANQCAESVTGWVEPQRVGEEGGRAREGERTYKIKVNTERGERERETPIDDGDSEV